LLRYGEIRYKLRMKRRWRMRRRGGGRLYNNPRIMYKSYSYSMQWNSTFLRAGHLVFDDLELVMPIKCIWKLIIAYL